MSLDLATENRQLREQLAQLLEQARHNEQILQRHQAFDLQFIAAGSFHELIDIVFRSFAKAASLDVVTLCLLDPAYEIRRILVDLNISLASFPHLLFLQEEGELGELCGRLSRPLLGPYAEHLHGRVFPEPLAAPASMAIVPLRRRRELIGCLGMGSKDPARFATNMATDFIAHMASILAICLENVINNERLKHIGLTDPLTGVNNRRYVERRLLEEIGRARRQGTSLACLYIDIDHFKRINDQIGHHAGDEVLREVAGRIKAELRLSDALGRFGGEEFVVLLTDTGLPEGSGVAERVRQSVAEPAVRLGSGEKLSVTVSIGVAALAPSEHSLATDLAARHLLSRADQALYQAKEGGRNRVVIAE